MIWALEIRQCITIASFNNFSTSFPDIDLSLIDDFYTGRQCTPFQNKKNGSNAFPADEAGFEILAARRSFRPSDQLRDRGDHLFGRVGHGAERRAGTEVPVFVVESDHGDVVRDADMVFPTVFQETERHPVGVEKHGIVTAGDQFRPDFETVLEIAADPEVPVHDRAAGKIPQRGVESIVAGRDAAAAGKPGTAAFQQETDPVVNAWRPVDQHAVAEIGVDVHKNELQRQFPEDVFPGPLRIPGEKDDRGHQSGPLVQQGKHVFLPPGADSKQREEAVPFEFQLEFVDFPRGDAAAGICRAGDDDSDEVVPLQPQVSGRDVGRVADPGRGFQDLLPLDFAQPRRPVQRTVDRTDGDSGQFGKFFQGCRRHGSNPFPVMPALPAGK